MADKIKASLAGLKVLKDWGVDTVYGIPSGTLSSFMDALGEMQGEIDFIQVKHEEVGAMAAAMQKKWGGSLAVCVGSGGPGATHLINGLYDAAMDNIPVVAILGARSNRETNMDAFQEIDQGHIYEFISVFNKRVAYPEQVPKMLDEAARAALTKKGVAVVEIPTSFGGAKIGANSYYSSGQNFKDIRMIPDTDEKDYDQAVEILKNAKRPVIFAGIGTRGAGKKVQELSKKIKAPIITTGKNFDTFDYDFEAFLGSTYRVAWKPANEAIEEADTVLFIGSNFPFAESRSTFRNIDKFIQVDINPANLGKRHKADVAILADASDALDVFLEKLPEVSESKWYNANVKNNQNWKDYLYKIEHKEEGELQFYQIYRAINELADEDAIYSVDVGNSTQTSIRHLHMTEKNMWRTSPLFATMGIALPGGIAAKRTYPDRQVINLIGDGAFSMTYPDIVTGVRYDYPTINIVFANDQYAFIKDKYEDTNKTTFGTDFVYTDYAKVGEAQGAVGFTIKEISEVDETMKKAFDAYKEGKTVVVDCKISKDRPIAVETLFLDEERYGKKMCERYRKKYDADDLVAFRYFLEEEGLESNL